MAPDLASPHDLGSKGRQGGAAKVLRSDPKLMASPCIPLQHPHSSPSLSDRSVFALSGQVPAHSWGVLSLVPWPGSALPMPACASPHGASHSPCPTTGCLPLAYGQAQPWFPQRGWETAQTLAAPGALPSWLHPPVPPQPGVNPSLATAPALTPGGNGSPERVQ